MNNTFLSDMSNQDLETYLNYVTYPGEMYDHVDYDVTKQSEALTEAEKRGYNLKERNWEIRNIDIRSK